MDSGIGACHACRVERCRDRRLQEGGDNNRDDYYGDDHDCCNNNYCDDNHDAGAGTDGEDNVAGSER